MDIAGLGKRVQIFVDEADRLNGRPPYLAILERLRGDGAAGATATRGGAGFGSHGRIRTARLADLASPLPIMVTWVDTPDRVERLLPIVSGMVREGLITIEDVQVAKHAHRGLPALRPSMTVGDLMTRDVTGVQLDARRAGVVDALIDRDFRAVPVADGDGRLTGIITTTTRTWWSEGGCPLTWKWWPPWSRRSAAREPRRPAREVMTHLPIAIRPTAPLEQAIHVMLTEGVKRLPVVDDEGRVVGRLSRADVLRSLGEASRCRRTAGTPQARRRWSGR